MWCASARGQHLSPENRNIRKSNDFFFFFFSFIQNPKRRFCPLGFDPATADLSRSRSRERDEWEGHARSPGLPPSNSCVPRRQVNQQREQEPSDAKTLSASYRRAIQGELRRCPTTSLDDLTCLTRFGRCMHGSLLSARNGSASSIQNLASSPTIICTMICPSR